MFMGEYRHNLDAKNRIIIPSKYREELGSTFIVTRGLDGCLTLYTLEKWDGIFNQLKKLPSTKRESRLYIHMLTSQASECEIDNQGRISLPSYLIKEAKIEKECVVVGVGDHVEIWDKDNWEKYFEVASESFEDIAEQLTDFFVE